MTQEELDALMKEGDSGLGDLDSASSAHSPTASNSSEQQSIDDYSNISLNPNEFRVEASKSWPPPPPTDDHKVVHQLDEVTKDTEVKGTQIFDQLEIVSNGTSSIQKHAKSLQQYFLDQEELFTKLHQAFPHIQRFQQALESTQQATTHLTHIANANDDISDASMQAMDLMQYQDIHRQKIERVINVMRALAQYMNSLFEGKIDDSKRVGSAVFIAGDSRDDLANDEDIEALIASFGKKS